MKEGSNIRYIQFETSQGIGYGCFVIHWSRSENQLVYRVGSAFCNPKDSFNKHLARAIARGRAKDNFQYGTLESDKVGFISNNEFGKILVNLFSKRDFTVIPNWARKAVSRGKYFLSLRQTRVTEGDLQAWREVFSAAQLDKGFKIIAHPAIDINRSNK